MTSRVETRAKWPLGRLGDLLRGIEAGVSPKSLDRPAQPGEFGVLKVSAVTLDEFRPEENKALSALFDIENVPTVHRGDLLLSRANTAQLLASPVLVDRDYPNLILSDKTLRLVPNEEVGDPRFILYALRHWKARHYFESRATGTSGSMRNVSQGTINDCPIPIPPRPEQRRIADILAEADTLRRKRANAIRLVNDLIPSVFNEMFGDPQANPRGWPEKRISTYMTDSQYGTAEKANESGRGVPVLRMNNIRYDGRLDLSELKWCEIVDQDLPMYTVRRGDLLFNRTNSRELVGKVAVWNRDDQYAFAGYLVRFRFNPDFLLPDYVSAVMNCQYGKRMLYSRAKPSVNMSNINATEFASLPILVPPIDMQRKFAKHVLDAERLTPPFQQSQVELDNLFQSLLQRAFRGDL